MEETPEFETVFQSPRRDRCMESRLVLQASGIRSEAIHRDGGWILVVARDDAAAATRELEEYRHENSSVSAKRPARVPIYGGAAVGTYFYACAIILVAYLESRSAFGSDWLAVGRMQAGLVMSGELWRTVTALTLHVDAGHLLSNLVFGVFFGLLAGRVLGGGIAWLAIVFGGTLGNLINAAVQAPEHSSIGASTAVFAALGAIVAHAIRPRAPVDEKPLRRFFPVIGGVLLLAFTGVGGERTDVVAHVTGFIAGFLSGWIGCRLPSRWLSSEKVQVAAGLAAAMIIVLAWIVALTRTV